MKILIMGAGRIGASVAESLVSEANDITVIDLDADKIAYLQSRFDLRGIVGDATSPAVLKEAGAEDTDMLLAVSSRDESNLVVCLLAARLFNIPTRIARVRNSELRNFPRILKEEGFETTAVIWPEQALTDYLIKLIDIPEALQVQEFGEGAANLIAVKAEAGSPMIGGTANELQAHIPKARAKIVAIFRNGRPLELTDRTLIAPNDEVVFICTPEHARLVTTQLRRRQEPAWPACALRARKSALPPPGRPERCAEHPPGQLSQPQRLLYPPVRRGHHLPSPYRAYTHHQKRLCV